MASKVVIAGGMAGLLALAAGGAFYLGLVHLPGAQLAGTAGGAAAKTSARPPTVALIDVRELTLRLADKDVEHYIKLNPVLAVRTSAHDVVEERVPLVRDRMITIVSARSSTELATAGGAEKLKKQMIEALKSDFDDAVIDIYFSGYLVE